jgi:hypothetical protein
VYPSSHSALLLIFLPSPVEPDVLQQLFLSLEARVGAAPHGRNIRARTSLQGSASAPGELGQDEADAPPLPSMEQPLTSLGSRLSHRLQRRSVDQEQVLQAADNSPVELQAGAAGLDTQAGALPLKETPKKATRD